MLPYGKNGMTPFLMLIGAIMGIDASNISIARGMAFGFIMTTIMS
jgi:hypothetical protein